MGNKTRHIIGCALEVPGHLSADPSGLAVSTADCKILVGSVLRRNYITFTHENDDANRMNRMNEGEKVDRVWAKPMACGLWSSSSPWMKCRSAIWTLGNYANWRSKWIMRQNMPNKTCLAHFLFFFGRFWPFYAAKTITENKGASLIRIVWQADARGWYAQQQSAGNNNNNKQDKHQRKNNNSAAKRRPTTLRAGNI